MLHQKENILEELVKVFYTKRIIIDAYLIIKIFDKFTIIS